MKVIRMCANCNHPEGDHYGMSPVDGVVQYCAQCWTIEVNQLKKQPFPYIYTGRAPICRAFVQ